MTDESCFMVEFGFSFLFFFFSYFFAVSSLRLSGVVSWCFERVQSRKDVIHKKGNWTIPTPKHKSESTLVSATPTNTVPFVYVSVNWDRPPHRRLRVLLFTNSVNLSYVQGLCMWDGFTVYHGYPRRLESLTVCRCHYKGRPSSTVISRAWVLVRPGLELAPFRSEAWHISNCSNQATVFFSAPA